MPRPRCSWSDGPRAVEPMLTLPEGQCRTLMPRGPSPVVPASRRCVRDTAPCMSPPSGVAHVRSPSLAAAAARGAAPSPPRLSLLLSLLRKAPPVLHLWLQLVQAPVSRAHTHA